MCDHLANRQKTWNYASRASANPAAALARPAFELFGPAVGGGLNAAYLFQSRLDDVHVAYGVTYWAK